jgi:hypothetical protein
MNQEELQALCAKWQKILRLQDWDAEAVFVRQSDLDTADARCFPRLSRKEAMIKILDPRDFHGERLSGDDGSLASIETLLIHELLHLHYEPYWDESQSDAMEQTIHSLAKGFQSLASS